MATTTRHYCDICGAVIPEGARRFTCYVDLTVHNPLSEIPNGGQRHGNDRREDICGEQCLLAAMTTLVRVTEDPKTTPPMAPISQYGQPMQEASEFRKSMGNNPSPGGSTS